LTTARSRFRGVLYWVATAVAATAFLVPGIGNLVRAPHIASDMAHLGYPAYFMTILGTWKVLGALVITTPGFGTLKEWAYAGMIFDLSGAAISRAVSDDGVASVLIPLALLGIVLASWALRPAGRRMIPAARLSEGVS
jgi:hypothetical protein